ncbi:O-methyltransferase [Lunatimonas salinarum]|uniref:O-methyltransferase n=1 Tax=Lunatimonas salinarum TaxID=1774590 RepID=UPI001AE042D6|nr:class I SAM-dependent methyltransferase [Lunatimonas salinarum]
MQISSIIDRIRTIGFIGIGFFRYFIYRVDHHSLHGPEAYRIYRFLRQYQKQNKKGIPAIEGVRNEYLASRCYLQIEDFGAGSKHFLTNTRQLRQIARVSSSNLSHNLLYQGLCSLTPRQTVIELGTCLGITTAYLAEVTLGHLFSFEASNALVAVARRSVGPYPNVTLVPGNADVTFPKALRSLSFVDFCLLDANHTYEATLRYARAVWPLLHEESILVIGDIHWSPEMNRAWRKIKCFSGVTLTMDFFECGVLFFKKGLNREDLVLYYPR